MGNFSIPEFQFLCNNEWLFTEKIDGTNIRVYWDGKNVEFGGREDNSQITSKLVKVLMEKFTNELMLLTFGDRGGVTLFGEGFGNGVQNGKCYLPDCVDFILFDIYAGGVWFKREKVENYAKSLDLKIVPIVGKGTIQDAISIVQNGFTSLIADCPAEGLVIKPMINLLTRLGEPIITKIKTRDFRFLEKDKKIKMNTVWEKKYKSISDKNCYLIKEDNTIDNNIEFYLYRDEEGIKILERDSSIPYTEPYYSYSKYIIEDQKEIDWLINEKGMGFWED